MRFHHFAFTLVVLALASQASAVVVRTTTGFPPPGGFGFVLDGALFPGSKYIGRQVTEVRIDWSIVVNEGQDAANVDASYLSPVEVPAEPFNQRVSFTIDGRIEGWSGDGEFNYNRTVDTPNMAFGPEWTFWSHQALGLPVDEVEVLRSSRVEIDYLASEGDFNDNGVVDLADYTLWRNNLGATNLIPWSPGDANGDGSVTVADFAVWRSQYGTSLRVETTPPAVSVAIPEPSGLTVTLGLCFLIGWRRSQVRSSSKST